MVEGTIELYIHFNSMCIFYYNLNSPKSRPEIDIQLISGFLSASSLFFNELGIGGQDRTFRILRGKAELRMSMGNQIHGTLLLSNLPDLDLKAYYELDVLTRAIIDRFEKKYINEIEEFITRGKFKFEGIEIFIEDEIRKMKSHMKSSYLMNICGIAINRNVKKEEAKKILISLNSIYSDLPLNYERIQKHHKNVYNQIKKYQKEHTSFNKIIGKVNKDSKKIWELFNVKIIPKIKQMI